MSVDEVFSGEDAESVVTAMKNAVAARQGFAVRLFVNSMSPLHFAQEVIRRYNEAMNKALPLPSSCDDFIHQGRSEGIATILEA